MQLYATIKRTSLAENINRTQTTIELDNADNLPTLGVGQYLVVVCQERSKVEVMHCTEISGTTLTVTRAMKDDIFWDFKSGAQIFISIDPDGYEIVSSGSGLELFEVMTLTSLRI